MKQLLKCIPVFVVLSMIVLFAGCGSSAGGSEKVESSPESTASEAAKLSVSTNSEPPPSDESSEMPSPATSDTATSLVAYFSWSGNTEQMATWIADESGSDLYQIIPKEAYGEDFDSCADRAKNELDNGIRPELTELIDAQTIAQYDTIYVGFPIWWYDLPMAMTAFLENVDLSGKTVIPFFSHNGSSSGASSLDTLSKICVNADVLTDDALSISGNKVESSETQIREWVTAIKK